MGKAPYALGYHRLVPSDLDRLDAFWRGEVQSAIEDKLLVAPEIFAKPLRQDLKGFRTLRVADYRVVFKIQGTIVHIIGIIHRSTEYKDLEQRI